MTAGSRGDPATRWPIDIVTQIVARCCYPNSDQSPTPGHAPAEGLAAHRAGRLMKRSRTCHPEESAVADDEGSQHLIVSKNTGVLRAVHPERNDKHPSASPQDDSEWAQNDIIRVSSSNLSGVLALYKLLGALGGTDHRFDQGDAQAAFLEFQQPINRTARGGGDHVFQFGRVFAGL